VALCGARNAERNLRHYEDMRRKDPPVRLPLKDSRETRRQNLLNFLNSKEAAWKDGDHPELKDGAASWVRKLRAEGDRAKGSARRG
jgi:hypothetical protein